MTTHFELLTHNQKIYFIAEFFWNLGRTFPHAILTILLLNHSLTLIQIGILQLVYMVTCIVFEFPSGVIADLVSRKMLYSLSIILSLIAYLLIFLNLNNFYILIFSWSLYGFSLAIKSGTIENDIVLEIRHDEQALTKFTKTESILFNISSIIGALLGSLVFHFFGKMLYIGACSLFGISFFISGYFKSFSQKVPEHTDETKVPNEIKPSKIMEHLISFFMHFKQRGILICVVSYFVIALFSQPFYQYWQVFYKIKNIPILLFGSVYTIFQLANIAGAVLYEKIIKVKKLIFITLLLMIPLTVLTVMLNNEIVVFMLFPLIIIPFYLFNQFLSIYTRQITPKETISSFSSFLGVTVNVSSLLILGMILLMLKVINILHIYVICFTVFSLVAIILGVLMNKELNKKKQ